MATVSGGQPAPEVVAKPNAFLGAKEARVFAFSQSDDRSQRHVGIAITFGVSAPLAKLLLDHTEPVMLAGLLPMFKTGTAQNLGIYLIPFYNAIEVMADIFAHSMRWSTVLVTLVSDIAYTGIAVYGLTRMFNSEKVMFSK
jgi:sodium transport system permease protein